MMGNILLVVLCGIFACIPLGIFIIIRKNKLDMGIDTVCLQCGHEFNRISNDFIVTIRCPECNSSNLVWRKDSNENLHDI